MNKTGFGRSQPALLAGTLVATTDMNVAVAETRALEEVRVVSRKREESAQDMAVAVQVFDSNALEIAGVREFADLQDLVSGLSLYNSGSVFPSINMRGAQTGATNAAADASVLIDLDGIPHNSPQVLRFSLFDLEAIEVLKGPQALHFGKNASAGILALRTKRPTDEFSSELEFGFEDAADTAFGHLLVSGPFNENWGGRLGVRYMESEGPFDNIWGRRVRNPDLGEVDPGNGPAEDTSPNFDETVIVGTLQGQFDRGSIALKIYDAHREGGQHTTNQIVFCNELSDEINPWDDCELSENYSVEFFSTNKDLVQSRFDANAPMHDYQLTQYAADYSFDLNETWTVQGVTGYVDIDNAFFGSVSGVAANDFGSSFALGSELRSEQFSQEIRIAGDVGDAYLTVGAYYDDRELNSGGAVFFTEIAQLIPDMETVVSGESWSAFAKLEYDFSDSLSLLAGARYTDEDRSIKATDLDSGSAYFISRPETSYDNVSPEVALTWRPADTVSLYVAYKEGFKSGGYDADVVAIFDSSEENPAVLDFAEETTSGFEVGAKTTLFDNTLRLNAVAFDYTYDNLQQPSVTEGEDGAVSTSTVNAAEAQVRGVEVDMVWLTPVEGLLVTGNLALLDHEFTDYVSQCSQYQIFVEPGKCDVDVDDNLATDAGGLLTGTGIDGQDRDGDPLRNAADYSGSLGIQYERPIAGNLVFSGNVLGSFSDEYAADRLGTPAGNQDSYVVYHAGLGLRADDDSWSLRLIGKNLTDEEVMVNSAGVIRSGNDETPESQGAIRNHPRSFTLQLTIRPDLFM